MNKQLNKLMLSLRNQGCFPSIYSRGKLWRAHVNMAGNYWEDAETPFIALNLAVDLWERAGKPMDGQAAN